MVDGAREAGKFIRKIIHSPIWRDVVDTSREIREFPRKIAREAGIEKDLEDLRRSTQGTLNEIGNSHIPTIRDINRQTQKSSSQNKQEDGEIENG